MFDCVVVNGAERDDYTGERAFDYIDEQVRQNSSRRDGESNIDYTIIQEISEDVRNAHPIQASSTMALTTQIATLDLASVFSLSDGLTSTQIASIYADGIAAYNEADGNDSFRHFTWNFRSTLSIGSAPTDIYTTNYEWANILLTAYDNYYIARYSYYCDQFKLPIMIGAVGTEGLARQARADANYWR